MGQLRSFLFRQQTTNIKYGNLLTLPIGGVPLIARVVAVGASPHSHTLRIARGSDDGVVKGAPVIAPDGVVGIVSQLTGSYSDVQLIVSPLWLRRFRFGPVDGT